MLPDYINDRTITTFVVITAVFGLIAAFTMGFIGRSIVKNKGYPEELNHGFAWGFWLGIIGLIVCAVKIPFNSMNGQFYNGQPYNGQPYNGQPYNGQPYNGQPNYGQPYNAQPYPGLNTGAEWQCSRGNLNRADANFCCICGARRN